MIPPEAVFLMHQYLEREQAAAAAEVRLRRAWRGVLGSMVRFARIPLACAAVVAIVARGTPGEAIALAIGIVVIVATVVLHASELFGSHPAPPRNVSKPTTYGFQHSGSVPVFRR